MRVITNKFISWLMSLTTLGRYFVLAVLFHVLILFILGSIKIVAVLPQIAAAFYGNTPPPIKNEDVDPFAALRDFEYNGPTLGGGGGTPGKGPGGIPTAAGTTPTEYKASIAAVDASAADSQVAEVIGVVSESASAVARLQGGIGGLAAPTTGLGEGKIGTAGVRGPGGGGFRQRVGPMRAQLISKNKGTQDTEKAVLAALRWLKEHQESNGSWAPSYYPEAMSALAALCFLGHGETPDSEEFGATVSKALGYLVTVVGPNGIVKSGNMYCQGAVTLALSEAYGMTQSPLVREPLERAVNAVVLAQKAKKTNEADFGGWRYTPTANSSDVSVTGWLVMGLKSARLAGISISDEVFELAAKYLWNMYGEVGGFGYAGPGHGYNTSAVGILCQQFLGHGDDKRIKKALDFYKTQKCDWETEAHTPSLYGWYYATQAMFQGGGSYWEHWNKEIRDTLVKAQASDGHWDDPPKIVGGNKQPVFSTTLCCLMLEVYYRYLPIYQEMERRAPAMPASVPGQTSSAK